MTRWTRRLLFGAIAMLVPVLAGCEAGANAPTLQFHPAANGTTTVVNGITIDDAFVLGPAVGSTLPAGAQAGVFLSLAAQNDDKLLAATSGAASSVRLTNGPVALPAGMVVDLSGPAPQIVLDGLTSPLSGGETVQLTLTFTTAGVVNLALPVEPAAYDYTTYSPPPPPVTPKPGSATASASPTASS